MLLSLSANCVILPRASEHGYAWHFTQCLLAHLAQLFVTSTQAVKNP
jgi:hypothetical protein